MKPNAIVSALTLALLVSAGAADSQQAPAEKTNASRSAVSATSLNGKITHKDTGLTVVTAGVSTRSVNVRINAKTSFFLNGIAANFGAMKVGDSVVVKYLPLSGQFVDAISVEAHSHRLGRVNAVVDPSSPPAAYPYCPNVGSGGTIEAKNIPCYCNACGGAGSGMVW